MHLPEAEMLLAQLEVVALEQRATLASSHKTTANHQ
jgi:hypothetical protein